MLTKTKTQKKEKKKEEEEEETGGEGRKEGRKEGRNMWMMYENDICLRWFRGCCLLACF